MNYEIQGVTQSSEIKKAYEEAVKNNAEYYRALSKSNLIYGWDETANKHVRAEIGNEWFKNPHYVEPVASEVVEEKPIEEVNSDIISAELAENKDYKALYEQAQISIKELIQENDYLKSSMEMLERDLDKYEDAVNDFKLAVEALKAL